MRELSLCYFSATAMEIPSLSRGVSLFRKRGLSISLCARTRTQLFDDRQVERFVKAALKSDVIFVSLHGGKASCPAMDALLEAYENASDGKAKVLHIQPVGGDEEALAIAQKHCSHFGTPFWDELNRYFVYGGAQNFCNMLIMLHNKVFNEKVSLSPPEKPPEEGIYHPDFPAVPPLEEYLGSKISPERPTVGIWFYQSYWLNGNLEYIDALIREVEKQGANALPVFHLRYKDAVRGNRGADYVVERFFKNEKGETRIDVLISPMMFSLTLASPEYAELYPDLGVPVIQAVLTWNSFDAWKESVQGLCPMDVSYSVAQPEFDGCIVTVPVGYRSEEEVDPVTGALLCRFKPIPDRVEKTVALALNWANLRRKSASERKVAIIFHNYPPRNDRIGCAAGLDSFESVVRLLKELAKKGYEVDRIYESGDELARDLLLCLTNDRRWLAPEEMARRCQIWANPETYGKWHDLLPQSVKVKLEKDWGPAPGKLMVWDDKVLFPGLLNGNVFITIQPTRGRFENIEKSYHDPHLSPPYHYLFFYRWIRDIFRADAVVHVGKHGSLEWLPGKAVGLSKECYPDLSIMNLPNVYPYIINDPSEGTQAKRRSYCCIVDHLTPVYGNADLYEDLAEVELLLKEYEEAKLEDPGKLGVLRPMIWSAVKKADLDKDLNVNEEEVFKDFDSFLEVLHAHLGEISDTMINDGLHILGEVPSGKRLVEYIVQLTRLPNGDVPSLRFSVLETMGFDYEELQRNAGREFGGTANERGWMIIREAHDLCLSLVEKTLLEHGLSEAGGWSRKKGVLPKEEIIEKVIVEELGKPHEGVKKVLLYIVEKLIPKLFGTRDEVKSVIGALEGKFVLPGPSGAPTRGQADILPTGRNFYSVDPFKIPSHSAWETGVRLGDALIEKCLKETGKYPESVGIVLFGGSTMRTKGDDLAEILYLMGVKPVWQRGSGNVIGLEVIPLDELKRPRIDVVPRISGFFRDAFPNLVELIDDAVKMVALLEEKQEFNLLRKHVFKDVELYRARGLTEEEAFREATLRIFGCPPGSYGAGVAELIETKRWKTQKDLADAYIEYSSHAYGKEVYGSKKSDAFKRLLSRMDITVKNEDSREYDLFSCTDYYNYYGGLIVASKVVRGKPPLALAGDSSNPYRVVMRTTQEEAKHIFRSRLLNPKWIEGMKRHGFKGAGDISKVVDIVLGWSATADVVEDWMYERLAHKYALDPQMQEWMKSVNPYALENILNKLLEAIKRGLWKASEDVEKRLRDAYLELEGIIEEAGE